MDSKYDVLREAIITGDKMEGLAATDKLINDGTTTPVEIFSECIQDTLNVLGGKFAKLEIFLPELLLSSEVVKEVQEKLLPLRLESKESISAGRAVIGTGYGDLHDIGKNIVGLMLQVNGFEVRDLGTSVESKAFIEAATDFNADLILMSALMLPTLPYIKDTINMIKSNEKMSARFKLMVGGGPVTQEWADANGADGYADDAIGAVEKAIELISK
jgi:5-methyltetrahydrofolate--homocysteine methyltransferase